MTAELLRRVVLFMLGALILVAEVWSNHHIRWLVVALALTLMGVVTLNQVRAWLLDRWPVMPVEGYPTHPQDPPERGPPLPPAA